MSVAVIVTAQNCGACKQFKTTHRDNTLATLKRNGVEVLELDFPNMGNLAYDTHRYPADLARHITAFPSIFYVTRRNWDGALRGTEPLNPLVQQGVTSQQQVEAMIRQLQSQGQAPAQAPKGSVEVGQKLKTAGGECNIKYRPCRNV